MKIAIVQNSLIPAHQYGGTERVIWGLGKALVQLGHEVVFIVKQGSHCPFAPIIPYYIIHDISQDLPQDIDIVHFHSGAVGMEKLTTPYVFTLHGNIYNNDAKLQRNTIFISQNHAQRFGGQCFVHNGLDWEDYDKPDLKQSQKFFHFLAKAAWKVKNVRGAIDLVKSLSDEKLYVLGGYRFNLKMGLRFTFTPKARFFGMVSNAEKSRYLPQSKGLLFPVLWHEPFGLAVVESLYYGAPVFATPYGSLPEIVSPEMGFLSNSQSELRHAMQYWGDFNRQHCHDYAREKFSAMRMTKDYLEKYERVLSGECLNAVPPRGSENKRTLLDWLP